MLNQVLLQLLNGLMVGSSLALVAAGLALLFGVLHVINFAQGGLLLTAIIWPLLQRSQMLVLLATLGLSLILEQLATNLLGGDTKLVAPPLAVPVPLGPILYPA